MPEIQPTPGVIETLPSLDVVLEQALGRSPSLQFQDALINKSEAQVSRTKLLLLDAVSAGVSTTVGSYGNSLIDQIAEFIPDQPVCFGAGFEPQGVLFRRAQAIVVQISKPEVKDAAQGAVHCAVKGIGHGLFLC